MPAASSVTSLGTALLLTAVLSTLLARLATSAVRLDTSLVTALRRTLPVLARFLRRLILAAFLLLPLLLSLPWLKQILELAVGVCPWWRMSQQRSRTSVWNSRHLCFLTVVLFDADT
jgi:hypothetical protein